MPRRCTKRRKDGRPYARNPWHDLLMETYDAAAHAWWRECERATSLYATEVREHKLTHPHPLLRDYMIHLADVYRQGVAA